MKNFSLIKATSCLFFSFLFTRVQAQLSSCPPNIGFENGNFQNWACDTGSIQPDGSLLLASTPPDNRVHNIFSRINAGIQDPYGNFPILCPNGSGYSIQLGNNETGGRAERVSYSFTIPAGVDDYSIIYHYALVIENPDHQSFEQPKFTASIFDVTANAYVNCGSFEFVASANLPGFQLSTVGNNIFYKPWSPVTINLNGFAGKTIRIEFTNNDCSRGGHFGYAYLDISEDCSSPIKGGKYCSSADSITLTAPFGFQRYRWFNENFTQLLGQSDILTLNPVPPPNTIVALEITPFPNLGCIDTVYTTLSALSDNFSLSVADSLTGCFFPGINLTASSVTSGSSPGLSYTYFSNSTLSNAISHPEAVTAAGRYFIKAKNADGCSKTDSVWVTVLPPPNMIVQNLAAGCAPAGVDLTAPALVSGSEVGLIYSYWRDSLATTPLPIPNAAATGTYFIKGESLGGCYNVKPVQVLVSDFELAAKTACGTLDLTNPAILNHPAFIFSFWSDAQALTSVSNPEAINSSGRYFVKGSHISGCAIIKPVDITILQNPFLQTKDSLEATYPATINLTLAVLGTNAALSYWQDAAATLPVQTPTAIGISGSYYIKATNANGCAVINPVYLTLRLPAHPIITAPNVFTPNGDGINDVFTVKVIGYVQLKRLSVFNRWGQVVYQANTLNQSWDGRLGGKPLPMGSYYWILEGHNTFLKQALKHSGFVDIIY